MTILHAVYPARPSWLQLNAETRQTRTITRRRDRVSIDSSCRCVSSRILTSQYKKRDATHKAAVNLLPLSFYEMKSIKKKNRTSESEVRFRLKPSYTPLGRVVPAFTNRSRAGQRGRPPLRERTGVDDDCVARLKPMARRVVETTAAVLGLGQSTTPRGWARRRAVMQKRPPAARRFGPYPRQLSPRSFEAPTCVARSLNARVAILYLPTTGGQPPPTPHPPATSVSSSRRLGVRPSSCLARRSPHRPSTPGPGPI